MRGRLTTVAALTICLGCSSSHSPSADSSGDADPPRVWAPAAHAGDEGPPPTALLAIIRGVVRYDEANDCFLVSESSGAYPVVWPAGTEAANSGIGVVLSDGRTVRVGDTISGGGGYLDVATEWGIPNACTQAVDGQVAVFNPDFPLDG